MEDDKVVFINHIRDYVRAQKELWQRVPLCALLADDGIGGGRENDYSLAYYSGYWRIRESSAHPSRAVAVDCADGELIYSSGPYERASDASVYRLGAKLELITAEFVLQQLDWDARRPIGLPLPDGYPSLEAWRDQIRKRTGLGELYVRPSRSK